MIYYRCLDDDTPSGGRFVLYRHVDILNAAGIPARILHTQPGFRLTWFPNETAVAYEPEVETGAGDILVVPETHGPLVHHWRPGVRKVIFNQNAYYTWMGYGLAEEETPYGSPDLLAVLTVSEDSRRYLQFAFPELLVERVHIAIDPLFEFSAQKEKVIACMPRKGGAELLNLLNLMKWRGELAGWEICVIDGMPKAEVARHLQRSAIFLASGYPEGCPAPPLEAAACGARVVGYTGNGGMEYWPGIAAVEIEPWQVVRFTKVLRVLMRDFELSGYAEHLGRQAAAYVRAHYSPEQEAAGVVAFWRSLL